MRRLSPSTIYCDEDGSFSYPKPPAPDAPPAEFAAWLRATQQVTNRIAASAHRAFDREFRRALRR